jgi:adenine-specific DNA methylase
MAIHKQEHRTGSLFERPFKRLPVTQQSHFNAVLSYIHINPEKHGVVPNFTSYPYSSYQSILSDKPTHLCRNEVVSWFASKMDFIKFHENMKGVHLKDNDDFIDG